MAVPFGSCPGLESCASITLDLFLLLSLISVYDLYGGYGGLYSGVLWQAYPGGPLVTAVPVPVPVQPVEWYRAPNGEVNYVYSLMYPTEQPIMEDNSPRSNSVESFQVRSPPQLLTCAE